MNIIVTGAKGQVGSEVTTLFTAKGHTVIGFDSQQLNICDLNSIEDAFKKMHPIDAVINCAAYTNVERAEDEKEKALLVNATGVQNLASICKKQDIPLLHLSTDYIFDGSKKKPYLESDPAHPINIYGASKWAGEEALRNTWQKHIILRVSWVFGAQGNNFVKAITKLAKERDTLKIINDQHGAPTAASHIAEVLLQITTHPDLKNLFGTYHYTDTPYTTWYDFAKKFVPEQHCKILAISATEYPSKASRPLNSRLCCDKIKKAFNIEQLSWETKLKDIT